MSDSDIDEYAKKLWGKLTNDGKGWNDNGDSKSLKVKDYPKGSCKVV